MLSAEPTQWSGTAAQPRSRPRSDTIRTWPASISGGSGASSTRSIRARSRTATATASATCAAFAERLDYLAWLGVDAIWLSPIFPSPMADFGYDVADYADVDPIFGTLADFDELIAEAASPRYEAAARLRAQPHLRPAPVVPRLASRRDNPQSAIGTSGAIRCPAAARRTTGSVDLRRRRPGSGTSRSGQYYFHAFLKEQPDLNWRIRRSSAAMCDVAALLVRPRRRRLPHRRDLDAVKGQAAATTRRARACRRTSMRATSRASTDEPMHDVSRMRGSPTSSPTAS